MNKGVVKIRDMFKIDNEAAVGLKKAVFGQYFHPGETLNCTIGFPVKEEMENQEYYFGINNQEDNPVKGNCVIKLYDLEKTEK